MKKTRATTQPVPAGIDIIVEKSSEKRTDSYLDA
jgi:hypothetical protein